MVDDATFRKLAMALHGATEAAHFDRTAYRRRVIFATLASDGCTANLRFPPERQAELVERFSHALRRVDNSWGDRGWTTLTLAHVVKPDLAYLLAIAHEAAK